MATGKTEVGRRLAQRLGRTFVDTDALVEAEAGGTVASIFAAEGEAGFRARERAAVERACAMADAVIAIRRRKLPDPAVLGNAGSFFKNPIVPSAQAKALHAEYPAMPVFRGNDDATRKLSAAWFIDACGWKGHRDGDAGVAPTHALVLVNHGRATGRELLTLARRIADSVHTRFAVSIEPEPRIIGADW